MRADPVLRMYMCAFVCKKNDLVRHNLQRGIGGGTIQKLNVDYRARRRSEHRAPARAPLPTTSAAGTGEKENEPFEFERRLLALDICARADTICGVIF